MIQFIANYEDQPVTITFNQEEGLISFQQAGTLDPLPIPIETIIDAAIDIERRLRRKPGTPPT